MFVNQRVWRSNKSSILFNNWKQLETIESQSWNCKLILKLRLYKIKMENKI